MFSRVHFLVSGRVQGLFFRAWTKHQADNLDLTGWVKNLSTGEVEIIAEGEKSRVEELIKAVHRGPPLAQVEKVTITWQTPQQKFTSFSVLSD